MKRLLSGIILGIIFLFSSFSYALSEEMLPPWEYPVAPEILENKAGYITMVNQNSLLEEDYEPHDLVNLTVKKVSSMASQMRKAASDAMIEMFNAAKEDGYQLYVKSAYRSYRTQKTMYYNRLEEYGRDDGVVIFPGASDHQTGLGVDILNYSWSKKRGMRPEFGKDEEAIWMAEHCHEFGFIIRYMADKQKITGIIYEPWHLRYVGIEAATYIMKNGLSLEEFDIEWKQYIKDYEAQGGDFQELLAIRSAQKPAIVVEVTEDGDEEIVLFYE